MAGAGKEYLTVDEVARIHRCGKRTVWRLVAERGVERLRFPGDRRTHIKAADAQDLFRPVAVDKRRRA